jgi:hypothetical protein
MKYCLILLTATVLFSCKKSEINLTPLASLNVTNAIVGGTTAKLGSYATTVSNNNFAQFGLLTGTIPLYIYPSTDSLKPYYNKTLNTNSGEVYSLFLTGTPTAVDAVVIKEDIPYRTDSTAGIRFINLAPSSTPLNITLSTTPAVNEVTGLAYKQNTEFKTYQGKFNSAYTFQVRDAAGALLTTFALSTSTVPRFANITLVIRQNGASVSVFRVNNDR